MHLTVDETMDGALLVREVTLEEWRDLQNECDSELFSCYLAFPSRKGPGYVTLLIERDMGCGDSRWFGTYRTRFDELFGDRLINGLNLEVSE